MCGFVGFSNFLEKPSNVLNSMIDKIAHRGPDGRNFFIDSTLAVGFCRLAIIDIAGGNQPMFNEDGTKVLVFNGEIYNSNELRTKLKAKGHLFKNMSDSEVLLHGYEEYGKEILMQLRGMFAFAIYDVKNKQLFCARDFFGIKPFYYYKQGRNFMFGSEIKSFLAHPYFDKKLNLVALEHYLSFQYSVSDETFFKNVFKLPPAHFLIYDFKTCKLKVRRYFSIEFKPNRKLKLDEWTDRVEGVFKKSVEVHKISDVEVGSLLSSGIDSSIIAKAAGVLKTFTVGFENEGYSEIDYANKFSKHAKIKNFNKQIYVNDYWSIFPEIQYYMDEPLADPAAVALYFACRLASKHVKVILSGEGADEIFGGYNVYKHVVDNAFYEIVPFFIRSLIAKIAQIFGNRRGVNYLVRHGTKLEDRFIGNAFIFNYKLRNKLINFPSYAPAPNVFLKPLYDRVQQFDDVTKMQFVDLNTWLVGDILQKADKMSMANSVELRVPFLDREIFEIARQIPTKFRVNRKCTKCVLRNFARRSIPEFVANKKKLGFPVPIRVWLRQKSFYKQVLNVFTSKRSSYFFKTPELLNLLNNHLNYKSDESRKIWTVFSFLIWHSKFFN